MTTPDSSTQLRQDWQRHARTGLHEAVLCEGKSLAQLQLLLSQGAAKQLPLLLTRLDAACAAQLLAANPGLDVDEVSRTAIYRPGPAVPLRAASIAVVSGGSSDIPVAREAVRTLQFHGWQPTELYDIGVSGLWRLQEQLPVLEQQRVIIAVAGMDAALPTVVGGLVKSLIIAVPSSTGYGMARQGETALNALLCSCAQGLVVVNIDNGFGAACAALRVLGSENNSGDVIPAQ